VLESVLGTVMANRCQNFEVFGSVVSLVPVSMMHNFAVSQHPAQRLSHDNMLVDIAVGEGSRVDGLTHKDVAVGCQGATTLPAMVAGTASHLGGARSTAFRARRFKTVPQSGQFLATVRSI